MTDILLVCLVGIDIELHVYQKYITE